MTYPSTYPLWFSMRFLLLNCANLYHIFESGKVSMLFIFICYLRYFLKYFPKWRNKLKEKKTYFLSLFLQKSRNNEGTLKCKIPNIFQRFLTYNLIRVLLLFPLFSAVYVGDAHFSIAATYSSSSTVYVAWILIESEKTFFYRGEC